MTNPKAKNQTTNNWFEKLLAYPYQTIFLVCFLLYAQILTFGLVHFDDHGFVLLGADTLKLSNSIEFFKHSVFWVMGDTTQETDIYYRPLQNVLYAVCNTISPRNPWSYHLAGLLLHMGVSCTLFLFLRELKYHASICLVFALIYSVHPVLVQAVSWIAGIGDQMAALFSLLSVIYFIRLTEEHNNAKYFFLHLLFLVAALFSKEVSIALILLCLFWYFIINKNKSSRKPLLLLAAGWGILVTIFFILRNNAIYSAKTGLLTAAISSFKVNGPLVFEYFEKMVAPYRLSPIPSREDAQLLVGVLCFIALLSLFIFKKRFTSMAFFGALWFAVFLFPTFIQQNPQAHFFAFEHRLYLPFVGILIIMIELLNINRFNVTSNLQKYGFASAFILYFGITFSHSRTFKDPYTFYDKAISSSPQSVIAYNGYGKLLLEDKKYPEAIEAFKKSYQYKPDDLQTTGKIADVYLKNLNNPQKAIVWFKKTLDIAPNSIEAAVSIGDAYWNFIRDTVNAITWYENALKIDPRNEFAAANLGVIYISKAKNDEGRKYLAQSLESNPKNLFSLKWMAISYFNEGKIADAVTHLNKAFENYPDDKDLQRNLMICYYKLNDFSNTERFATLYLKNNKDIPAEIESYLKNNKR